MAVGQGHGSRKSKIENLNSEKNPQNERDRKGGEERKELAATERKECKEETAERQRAQRNAEKSYPDGAMVAKRWMAKI
jgi:hypothetical protein